MIRKEIDELDIEEIFTRRKKRKIKDGKEKNNKYK